ncbi:MAG: tetratricopeptide repeat protein [Candidatus Scalindua sp.]|jgi:tetratricopeptide (TPR) repeat protein|nr:tetratricopeptide repeat protein [Candidatus Scalindua sp.]MBT5304502.1 tetratricopeptide repeat protein [Candidatus Scalindua sp.]MBT6049666.1 tetratricopeptide repeat protein [Candidatus Scalindua sp.]MBT6227684.1 tetratricopeptide repeat protein [Candidatus Scalindua sp.]MBT6561755.1 tetratricopeptide repeat protein [Candidatus Scalindua sp.]
MSQTIIRSYLKAIKEQFLRIISIVNIVLFLSKLLTKRYVRCVCVVTLIAGIFCHNFSMSDTHAEPAGAVAPEITVSQESRTPGKDAIDHFNLGVDHQKRGDAIKAIEEYENVLTLDPDNAEAHNNLGAIYKEQGNLDKALEHYQFVMTSNPGMDEVHNNLGVIYYLRGDHEKAVKEYQKALELNPDNLMCLVNLGLVYKAQGMGLKTIETLETILTIEPFQAEAHYNLAILYEELGHLEAAIQHYTRFVQNAGQGYPELAERVAGHIEDLKVSSFEVVRKKEISVFPGGNQAY